MRFWARGGARGRRGASALEGWVFQDPVGELGAGGEAELREDVLHVGVDRALGEVEALGDLAVAESFGDQPGDLLFAAGERPGGLVLLGQDRALAPGDRDRVGER